MIFGVDPDTALHAFYDVVGDGEAEAVAVVHRAGLVAAVEALKNVLSVFRRNFIARVCDIQGAMMRILCEAERHGAVWIGIFLCVVEKNLNYLLHVGLGALHMHILCELRLEHETFFEEHHLEGQGLIFAELREIDPLRRQLFEDAIVHAGKLQEALDESAHLLRHRVNVVDELQLLRLVKFAGLQKLDVCENDRERGLQLMARVRHELALLLPGLLNRVHRPAREADRDYEENEEACDGDQDAVSKEVVHCRELARDICENEDRLAGGEVGTVHSLAKASIRCIIVCLAGYFA